VIPVRSSRPTLLPTARYTISETTENPVVLGAKGRPTETANRIIYPAAEPALVCSYLRVELDPFRWAAQPRRHASDTQPLAVGTSAPSGKDRAHSAKSLMLLFCNGLYACEPAI
jgi:hypothetical protein